MRSSLEDFLTGKRQNLTDILHDIDLIEERIYVIFML